MKKKNLYFHSFQRSELHVHSVHRDYNKILIIQNNISKHVLKNI